VREVLERALGVLPRARTWIESQLAAHGARATPLDALGLERVPGCFSAQVLRETRRVLVGRVPIPPMSELGLPELASVESMGAAGVTFKDLCFVHEAMASESIYFHETVHAIQWRTLGVDGFILTYGVALLRHGYAKNPLEAIAFDLQSQFDRGQPIADAEEAIRRHALAVREQTADLFRAHGLPSEF
jgi:hypothetical protein